jgi:hypothetical protein
VKHNKAEESGGRCWPSRKKSFLPDIGMVRMTRPEMGRIRLGIILLKNWPNILLSFISYGNHIVRGGFFPPTVMLLVIFACAKLPGRNHLLDIFLFQLSIALVTIGSWAVFGVISTVFNMPVSEGILHEVDNLVKHRFSRLQ